jgi:predicted protein tyrosine phosphatase
VKLAKFAQTPNQFIIIVSKKFSSLNQMTKGIFGKSLNIVRKHVFICSNPYIYTTVAKRLYNRDRSLEVDDVEGLAATATKHLELLKQKDVAESSFIIEKIVGKLLSRTIDLFQFISQLQDSNR